MDDAEEHELELLRLIILGYTDEQIARRLFISTSTVRRRLHDLMVRAGARNRHHLCAIAVHRGWIPLDVTAPDIPADSS